jgi:hypothetical protein
MVAERKHLTDDRTVTVNGISFELNSVEFKEFLEHCAAFMDISKDGFGLMIDSISDSVIDNENPEMTLEAIRPQLKFMRELSLFLKTIYASNH